MIVVRVYLKSGQRFDVCAEGVGCKYNGLTGELTSFNYTGAVSGIPLYEKRCPYWGVVDMVRGADGKSRSVLGCRRVNGVLHNE